MRPAKSPGRPGRRPLGLHAPRPRQRRGEGSAAVRKQAGLQGAGDALRPAPRRLRAGHPPRGGGGGSRRALLRPGSGPLRRAAHPAGAGLGRGAAGGGRGAVLGDGAAGCGVQRPVRRGRGRGLLRRQAEHRHPGPPPPLYSGGPGLPRRAGEHSLRREAPCGHGLPPAGPEEPAPGAHRSGL